VDNDYEHQIKNEPTSHDAPADFDRQYELLREKLRDEHDRCDKIEGKVATLIAGTVALVGFSLDHVSAWWQSVAVVAFAYPLWEFYHAFKTIDWDDAPSSSDLKKHPWYPQTTVASAAVAMANCIESNGPKISEKAKAMNRGFRGALLVTALIVATRIAFILTGGNPNEQHGEQHAAIASPSASATATAHAGKPSDGSGKGRRKEVAPSAHRR
jgi:hypothetical protein